MTKLTIIHYPDERLHKVAQPITVIDERIKSIAEDMLETMYDAGGIGLAATQVNVHERLVVIDLSEKRDAPITLVNPEIIEHSEEYHISEEGCLSVPDIREKVDRFDTIKIKALDLNGQAIEIEADGLMAVCLQHELDHLMGKVFVEYLSPLKLSRIKSKLRKKFSQNAE